MWCSHCQQDVPGVVSARDRDILCCPRCSEELSGEPAPPPQQEEQDDDWNDWELTDSLEEASTALDSLQASEFAQQDDQEREDDDLPARLLRAAPPPSPAPPAARPMRSGAAWALVLLGVTSLVCGLVLIVWSFFEARPELWQWGMPAALAGQGALLIGFVLQLDSLWQAGRANAEQLARSDAQLAELAKSIQMLNVTQSGPSQSFYAHYAAGARPELLMADLRSQLDLLASRMSTD